MELKIKYPQIGICGLSCILCPKYNTESASKCNGCKTESRMLAGCPFITCAIKKKGIEFCWQCDESGKCDKWKKHRDFGKKHDTFKSYSKLETDIAFIQQNSIAEYDKQQKKRAEILQKMIAEFNEGRSKNYYCIVSTLFDFPELTKALDEAKKQSEGLCIQEKSACLHAIIEKRAKLLNISLSLRK